MCLITEWRASGVSSSLASSSFLPFAPPPPPHPSPLVRTRFDFFFNNNAYNRNNKKIHQWSKVARETDGDSQRQTDRRGLLLPRRISYINAMIIKIYFFRANPCKISECLTVTTGRGNTQKLYNVSLYIRKYGVRREIEIIGLNAQSTMTIISGRAE